MFDLKKKASKIRDAKIAWQNKIDSRRIQKRICELKPNKKKLQQCLREKMLYKQTKALKKADLVKKK